MIRPTKKGESPIWWVRGSMVLTRTSLMSAVTAVTPARTTMGSQSVILHQAASVASGPAEDFLRCAAVSLASADGWAAYGGTTATTPGRGASVVRETAWNP